MTIKYRNSMAQWSIIVLMIALLSFLPTFAQEDDGAQVRDRMDVIDQSSSQSFPNISTSKTKTWLISDVLTRLFTPSGKIRSIFIAAFNDLSDNTVPLWTWDRLMDSCMTQSWSTLNVDCDLMVGNIYVQTNTVISDIWLETWSGIYYSEPGIDVGIGLTNPQAKLDVAWSVIVGNTTDLCGASKIGTVKFNNGLIQYCSFIDYVWVTWDWSDWSTTCWSATRNRVVTCQDPAGNISGSCTEPEPASSETSVQWNSTCGWSSFGSWSTTCGEATRTRTCSTGDVGSANCVWSATDTSTQWSSTCGWGTFGGWSTTCGDATRTRVCSTGASGSANCVWSDTSSSVQWSSTCGWSGYTGWSTTCGAATRTRTCSTGTEGSTHCAGFATDSSIQWSSTCGWGWYSWWSATCWSATRSRVCNTGAAGSANCAWGVIESGIQWSSTCGWGSWGSYGSCSKTCWGGTKSRSRSCSTGSAGSANCVWSASSSTSCNTQSCYTWVWSSPGTAPSCTTACGTWAYTTYGSYSSCQWPWSCDPGAQPSRNSRYCPATAACPTGCTFYRPFAWSISGRTCIEWWVTTTTSLSAWQIYTSNAVKCSWGTSCYGTARVQCVNGNIVQLSGATCRAGIEP